MKIHEQITEETWCRGSMARSKVGNMVVPHSKSAFKRCLLGWLHYRYGDSSNLFYKVAIKINAEDIAIWNDAPERTFQDVLKLCKELDI